MEREEERKGEREMVGERGEREEKGNSKRGEGERDEVQDGEVLISHVGFLYY